MSGERYPDDPVDTGMTEDHRRAFESSMWEQLTESVELGWMTPEEAEECFKEYRERFNGV